MRNLETVLSDVRGLAVAFGIVGIIMGTILVGSAANVALAQPATPTEKVSALSERVAKLEANVDHVQASVLRIEDTISRFFFITLGAFFSGLIGAGGLVYGIKQSPGRK